MVIFIYNLKDISLSLSLSVCMRVCINFAFNVIIGLFLNNI